MASQNSTAAFVRFVTPLVVGFQLFACSSQPSSEKSAPDKRAYLSTLNDSIAMSTVFRLTMDTTYITAGPSIGEVAEIVPRWQWEAKFDSIMARYPMADISHPNERPTRVFYTVENTSKSDSLYKVNYTAEIAEMQDTEGTLGTNSGTSVFRRNEHGWYLASNTYNSHLSEDLAASGRQDKLVASLGKASTASAESHKGTAEPPAEDTAPSVPNPAIKVSKLRYFIAIQEERHGEGYRNDYTVVYPAHITIDGEVVESFKDMKIRGGSGSLFELLKENGNGSGVPVYEKITSIPKPPSNVVKTAYNPYTSNPEVPTHAWTLYDGNNTLITSYKDFPFVRGDRNSAAQGSDIFYLGNNRFWVSCGAAGNSFLINQKGNKLGSFAAGLSSFVPPDAYPNDVFVMNHNTVIDRNGHVLYKNDKLKIVSIIDDYVLLANEISDAKTKPTGYHTDDEVYAYINYRSGKVIYRVGDYEKKQQL